MEGNAVATWYNRVNSEPDERGCDFTKDCFLWESLPMSLRTQPDHFIVAAAEDFYWWAQTPKSNHGFLRPELSQQLYERRQWQCKGC